MRTFRRCITEFVLDPAHEPAGFQSWLWRYPVRIDIAIEYLGITPEEYADAVPRRRGPALRAAGPAAPAGLTPRCRIPARRPAGAGSRHAGLAGTGSARHDRAARVPGRDLPELLRVLRAVGVGLRVIPQRRRRRRRHDGAFPPVRAVLPGGPVAAVPRGAAGAGPGRAAGVRPALAQAARVLPRRLLLRAAAGHLRRAAAAGGRRGQPGLHPPARRVPDAARRLRDGPRRSRRPGRAGRGRRGPHAPAGAVGRAGGGPVAVGGAAADRAGGAARAAAARLRAGARRSSSSC